MLTFVLCIFIELKLTDDDDHVAGEEDSPIRGIFQIQINHIPGGQQKRTANDGFPERFHRGDRPMVSNRQFNRLVFQ